MNNIALAGDQFAIEIAQVEMAFSLRQPDALERAERLRDRLVYDANRTLKIAELQIALVENGVETRRDLPSGSKGFSTYAQERRAEARAAQQPEPPTVILSAEYMLLTGLGTSIDLIRSMEHHSQHAINLAAVASNVSDLIAKYDGKHLRDGIADPGPTTEMLYQVAHNRKGDPVLRLRALGKIDDDHVRAARDIEAVVRHITAGIGIKVQRLPTASGISPEGQIMGGLNEMERGALMAAVHAQVYIPWAKQPAVRPHVAMLLRLIVDGVALRVAAREAGVRWATACSNVAMCLARYGKLRSRFNRDQREESQAVLRG